MLLTMPSGVLSLFLCMVVSLSVSINGGKLRFKIEAYLWFYMIWDLIIIMENEKENKIKQISIPPLHTYMIKEADSTATDQLKLSLLSGEAEVMGMEIKKYYPLRFKMPCIILAFSWDGCEIEVEWPEDKNSKSSEEWLDITSNNHVAQSPMIKYLNLHYQLTIDRKLAQDKFKKGPRLAIIGGQNSGIAYSSRLLLTWAGKMNMKPIFVDLDLDNSLFLDGSIGACIYDYKVTTKEDIYRNCEKICMVYGNRRLRNNSFLNISKLLARNVNARLNNEMRDVKWTGTNEQICSFASGIILQCPRVLGSKKQGREILTELFNIFQITHALIIDSPDLSSFVARNCPGVIKEIAPKIEGIDNMARLTRATKVKTYLGGSDIQQQKLAIDDVLLYEVMEEEHREPYVRRVDIRTELVNKTGIAIIDAQHKDDQAPEDIAKRVLQSVVVDAIRISRIGETEVTFDIAEKDQFQKLRQKIWVSMIAERTS